MFSQIRAELSGWSLIGWKPAFKGWKRRKKENSGRYFFPISNGQSRNFLMDIAIENNCSFQREKRVIPFNQFHPFFSQIAVYFARANVLLPDNIFRLKLKLQRSSRFWPRSDYTFLPSYEICKNNSEKKLFVQTVRHPAIFNFFLPIYIHRLHPLFRSSFELYNLFNPLLPYFQTIFVYSSNKDAVKTE